MSLEPVAYSPDLQRVINIPRRVWTIEGAQELSDRLTPLLTTDHGKATGAKLFPRQALCLKEAHEVKGGFFALPVGDGKTLAAYLLPYVLNTPRTLYLNPANLIPDRQKDFALLSRNWVTMRPPHRFASYTELTLLANWNMLELFKPQLVIADEGDLLRNPDSSMCMRLDEYEQAHPDCVFIILTGTPMRKSIKNFCHLLRWTHKKLAPIPLTYKEKESWSNALDEKVDLMKRQRPGALMHLVGPGDEGKDDLETVRRAFRRRLWETPGIIYTDEQSCNTPIYLRLLQAPEDPILDEAFRMFRTLQVTPHPKEELRQELLGPLEMYRVGNELGCGFFNRWDPQPPYEWREARKAWGQFVRCQIGSRGHTGMLLATELMVAREFAEHPLHLAWKEIQAREPVFKPNSVPEWLTGSVLSYAKEWIKVNGPAIVWCPYLPVGHALSRLTGLQFYGAGGVSEDGESILNLSASKSAICSLQSNKRGRNLQSHTRNLSIGWPQPATDVEQMLGRGHRRGQDKPIYFDVLISCAEHLYAIDQSYREAGLSRVMQGQTQKILRAQIDTSLIKNYAWPRWAKSLE